MALIDRFERKNMDRNRRHDPITAHFTTFEQDGQRFLQIDTYGRDSRAMPGKISQSIQLSEASAAELAAILRREFG